MISTEVFMDINSMRHLGHSLRKIARDTGLHRKTVTTYLANNSFPKYHREKKTHSVLEPYTQIIKDYLEEDNYQATWILGRLKRMGYTGSYETLKLYVRTIKEQKQRIAYTRFETEPGLQAQFDWGEFTVQEADGRKTTLYGFIMVLGYSRAMYVEFVERCTLETFMDCHIRAFKLLKGVPAEILYDNMKHVVISRENGKAVFNTEFLHFAHHYGFKPVACPPYSPWVKGKVERPISYIREQFWRGYNFTSVVRANEEVQKWLSETANQRIHGTHHEEVQKRWEEEIPFLGQLPPSDYDTSLKFFRKVYKDCLLSFGGNRYYVPGHVGKRVLLKVKGDFIRIYHDADLLAAYHAPERKGTTVGIPRQRPPQTRPGNRPEYWKMKGKATRGLVTQSLYPEVRPRPLSEYEKYAQGGVPWNS
jgi:transposase